MSGRRRHRSSSSERTGLKTKLLWAGAGVLVLFLVANLAFSFLRKDDATGRPQGLLSEDAVAAIGLWVPLAVMGAAALTGAWFAWQSHQRSERSSTLWLLRAFIVSALCGAAVAVGTFELKQRGFAILVAFLFAVQTTLFAISASRSKRNSSHDVARQASAPGIPLPSASVPADEAEPRS